MTNDGIENPTAYFNSQMIQLTNKMQQWINEISQEIQKTALLKIDNYYSDLNVKLEKNILELIEDTQDKFEVSKTNFQTNLEKNSNELWEKYKQDYKDTLHVFMEGSKKSLKEEVQNLVKDQFDGYVINHSKLEEIDRSSNSLEKKIIHLESTIHELESKATEYKSKLNKYLEEDIYSKELLKKLVEMEVRIQNHEKLIDKWLDKSIGTAAASEIPHNITSSKLIITP